MLGLGKLFRTNRVFNLLEEAKGGRVGLADLQDDDPGVYAMIQKADIPRAFAERPFRQPEGFGSYGFPESHAASFAKISYASSWMKHHHPDVFCAALMNSQPMAFTRLHRSFATPKRTTSRSGHLVSTSPC